MAQIDIEQPESLQGARNWLQYVRRSSPPSAGFTVSPHVETMLGKPKKRLKGAAETEPERALLSYALSVANGETDVLEMRRAIQTGRAGQPGRATERIDSSVSREEQVSTYLQGVKAARDRLSGFFELVCSNRRTARESFDVRGLERVWSLLELRDGRLAHHLVVLDLQAFEALVFALLLDESEGKDFGRDLRRCKAKDCKKFFFKELTGGRPRDKHCSSACYETAHDKDRERKAKKS